MFLVNTEVELLKRVLEIYSPTGNTDELGNFFVEWCKEHGMDATIVNGMLVINAKASTLLMLGHMDTVPGELPVELKDNILTGRGAADAKGPLCAAISAIARHPELYEHVQIVAAHDEEGRSTAAMHIREHYPERPVIILEPSTWEGITLSYMGRLSIRCTSECPPSHSGHNSPFASEELARVWNVLAVDYLTRICNISASSTTGNMFLDIRYRDTEPEDILAKIPKKVNVDILEQTPPYTAEKNTKLVRAFLKAVRDASGTPRFKKKTGTSDMNVLGEEWKAAPMLAYGPGDGRLGHTNSEQIEISEYKKGIEVLENALLHLSKE
jgi:LysW-gamma-L-lysine carboxypeptidase